MYHTAFHPRDPGDHLYKRFSDEKKKRPPVLKIQFIVPIHSDCPPNGLESGREIRKPYHVTAWSGGGGERDQSSPISTSLFIHQF